MKSRKVYLMLCVFGGIFGLHHFYLLKFGKGFLYMFTAGLLMIGLTKDIIYAFETVDQYNTKRGFVNSIRRK